MCPGLCHPAPFAPALLLSGPCGPVGELSTGHRKIGRRRGKPGCTGPCKPPIMSSSRGGKGKPKWRKTSQLQTFGCCLFIGTSDEVHHDSSHRLARHTKDL